jgi:LacI family transcriptional regulator
MGSEETPARRKRSPRFLEIADAAGVSPSTVDRVLNERGSVSAATRAKVVAAARELGVPRVLPDTRHGLLHLDFLLPENDSPFFHRLHRALQRSIQMLDKRVVVHRQILPPGDDALITRAMLTPRYRRHGLAVVTRETEPVREALRQVIAAGEPVVTLVTDIPDVPRLHYAGIDNYRAGRTAGYFLARLARRPGRVLFLRSRTDYRAHAERMDGCHEALAAWSGTLVCDPDIAETFDDPDRCYNAVAKAMKHSEPLAAIYNSGGGSRGVEAALRRFGGAGVVAWAAHEISDEHRQYLAEGTLDVTIDQDPDNQVISAIQHLLHANGIVETPPPFGPNEFRLYCAENARREAYLAPELAKL